MKNRPNLVLFVPDSYRGDVQGHLGDPAAATPNLDAMVADQAVSYRNAFAQNPVCTPSRCSFMTGWYLHTHGHRSMLNMLKPYEPNLLSVLRREGYHVAWGGKNDLVAVSSKDDYMLYCDERLWAEPETPKLHQPTPLADDDPRHAVFYRGLLTPDGADNEARPRDECWVEGAVRFIQQRTSDQPFCLYLPLGNPHPAYLADAALYDQIDPDALPPRIPDPSPDGKLPEVVKAFRDNYGSDRLTDEDWREIKRVYYAMCTFIDAQFGRVVDALKQQDLYDDTIILFFSDHGDFAGDYGLPEKTHATLQDSLLRVPLVIKPAAGMDVKPGIRKHLAELVDVTATLYDLLDISPGYDHQGRSLRDSLAGSDDEIHAAVFAEVGMRPGEEQFINKEVANLPPGSFYDRQAKASWPCHRKGSYTVACRTQTHKLVRRPYIPEDDELYDLTADPGELQNLAADPNHADVKQELNNLLLDHFLTTADVMPKEQDSRRI